MRILVVDDSKVMRSIVRRTLRQAGFGDAEVEEAGNGKEGLDAALASAFDLVLSDWNMPEMNGLQFLQALRGAGNNTPFGFVTSEGTAELQASGIEAGAAFFVTKPFTPEDFESKIRPALAAA